MDSTRVDTDDISGWPVGDGYWIVKAVDNRLMFFRVIHIDEDGIIETIGFRQFGGSTGYLGGSRYFLLPDNSYLWVTRDQVPDPILETWNREFANG